mgnify:CR=1 FL=1
MARTFKQYGCAHDTGGSLTAVVEIGGVEVYNGSVTADTDAHSDSPEHVELFNFDLAEDVSGDTAWSVTVTGTDDASTMHLGETGTDTTTYHTVGKVLTNGATDGEAYAHDMAVVGYAPMIANGETWTMTAALTIPVYAYDPPLPE